MLIIATACIFEQLYSKWRNMKNEHTDSDLKSNNSTDLKNDFLSVVKHEFRTPMVLIEGYCEMLTDLLPTSNLTQDQIECIQNLSKGVMQLEKTMDSILDVYSLESHIMKFHLEPISISELMIKIIDSFSDLAKQKEVSIVNSTNTNLVIISDRQRITQVFHNLIENSLSFIATKHGEIEIGVIQNKDVIVFFVKDNGFGIPQEKQQYLFQKFFQADATHRRRHFGMGLGLTICKGIVENLGGKIWLESVKDVGTTFYFSLPVKK